MSTKTLFGFQLKPAQQEQLAQLTARWKALGARERQALQLVAGLLGLLLLWAVAVQPALRTLTQVPQQLTQMEGQLQEMQRLALEVRELREQPPVPAAQALEALKAASARLGAAGRLAVTGERAVLTLTGVDQEALQSWLSEVRSAARARPIEANLQRGAQGYAGTIVLVLSAAAP